MSAGCAHRWRIEEPNGQALLIGVCRACGARRQFQASESAYWERRGIDPDAAWGMRMQAKARKELG